MRRGRAYRREKRQRAIERARVLGRRWGLDRPKPWWRMAPGFDFEVWVRRWAAVHCRPCSCWGCRQPKGTLSRAALRAALNEREQVTEARER